MSEIDLSLFERIKRGCTQHRVCDWVAGILIFGQSLAVGVASTATWFKYDDIVYLYEVSNGRGLADVMFAPYSGHLIPGSFLATWLLQLPSAMDWRPFAIAMVTMQAAASFLTWRVLRSFFGSRPIAVLLFSIYAGSAILLSVTMWWAAAIEYLPLEIGLPATILLAQRAIRSGRWADQFLPAISLAVSLFFFEKALLFIPIVFAIAIATPIAPGAGDSWRERIRSSRRAGYAMLACGVVYSAVYVILTAGATGKPQVSDSIFDRLSVNAFSKLLAPTLVGGPHSFYEGRVASTSSSESLLVLGVLICLVAWSAIAPTKWIRFWLISALMIAANILLIKAANRNDLQPRFFADLVFPFILFVGFAVSGSVFEPPETWRSWYRKLSPRKLQLGSFMVLGLALAVSLSGFLNFKAIRQQFRAAPAEAYFAEAESSAKSAQGDLDLLRQSVPKAVLPWGYFPSYNKTDVVLSLLNNNLRFPIATDEPHMVLESGVIFAASVSDDFHVDSVPGQCVVELEPEVTATVDLESEPILWTRYGLVDFSVIAPTLMRLHWGGGAPVEFTVTPENSMMAFQIVGGGSKVELMSSSSPVCIHALHFGELVPN